MIKALLAIAFALVIAAVMGGCETDTEKREKIALNQKLDEESLSKPEHVGQVNGQEIYRVTIHNTPDSWKHYVYFVGDVQTMNKRTSVGKGTRSTVYVTIGDKQVPLSEVKQAVADAEAEILPPK